MTKSTNKPPGNFVIIRKFQFSCQLSARNVYVTCSTTMMRGPEVSHGAMLRLSRLIGCFSSPVSEEQDSVSLEDLTWQTTVHVARNHKQYVS
jgi:hypothetical protein